MRRETIECDVCHEDIGRIGSGVALRDVCVVVNIVAGRDHVELAGDAAGFADGSVEAQLHVCFSCADDNISGWGPLERFTATPKSHVDELMPEDATLEDELANVAPWLDVVVQPQRRDAPAADLAAAARARDAYIVLPAGSRARNRRNERAPLVRWPVGSHVWVHDLGADGHVVVAGYLVRPKDAFSWDRVSPRCRKCESPTEYKGLVTIHKAAPKSYEVLCTACSATAGLLDEKLLTWWRWWRDNYPEIRDGEEASP